MASTGASSIKVQPSAGVAPVDACLQPVVGGGPASLNALEKTHVCEGGAYTVTVLPESQAAWGHYKALLQSARESILLVLWYVFQDDVIINEVQAILEQKLREGVKVKIIHSNNAEQKELMALTNEEEGKVNLDFAKQMRDAGADVVDYSKDVVPTRGTHRKALVVDRSVCIAGSRNVNWIYQQALSVPRTHAEICFMVRNGTRDVVGNVYDLLSSNDMAAMPVGTKGEFVQSKPHPKEDLLGKSSLVEDRYYDLITAAKSSIQLTHWSFIPVAGGAGAKLMTALKKAVQRGVEVSCVFNGLKQTKTQTEAGQALVNELLTTSGPKGSPKIFVNDGDHIIHCKYMVVDGVTSVLGSFNLDDYSFVKNAEDVWIIQSPELATNLLQHSEWLRDNMPCLPAKQLTGCGLCRAKWFGCCAGVAVEAAF